MRRHVVESTQIPKLAGASQAISVDIERTTYLSGQLPEDPSADVATQTRQVLERVRLLLEAAGLRLDNLHKVVLYVTDLADLPAIDAIYTTAFVRPPPARSVVRVAELEGGARLMMDGIAGG